MLAHVFLFLSQVNGIDTVRVPVVVLPYEDKSAAAQKKLKILRQVQAASLTAEASPETAAEALEESEVWTSEAPHGESPEPLPTKDETGPPTENRPKD